MQTPLIIGHRGACGYRPEHTLESYELALEMGADVIETDVVATRDGHLICRHDCELSLTTDVSLHPEFAARKRTNVIDAEPMEGWFTEDFTIKELARLRARERFNFRNRAFDGRFSLVTLEQLLNWASRRRTRQGDRVRVIVEIKHANHHRSVGLPMDVAVAEKLESMNLTGPDAGIWVECFEIDVLRRLRERVHTPLIQLINAASLQPGDVMGAGGPLTYGQMITPTGLAEIATYASGIGVWKRLIVPSISLDPSKKSLLGPPSALIAEAHTAGLAVHAWTFRNEARFLADDCQADPLLEYRQFKDLGVDGLISDFPDVAVTAIRGSKGAR